MTTSKRQVVLAVAGSVVGWRDRGTTLRVEIDHWEGADGVAGGQLDCVSLGADWAPTRGPARCARRR
jgi:hypothetical protein